MTQSATDVMQQILFSAVLDAVEALKKASKGLPNNLLRDLNALHVNTAFADLPPELQAALQAAVRSAFQRLQKEGYSVSNGEAAPPRRPAYPARTPDGAPRPPRTDRPRPAGDRPDNRRGPRGPRPGGRG